LGCLRNRDSGHAIPTKRHDQALVTFLTEPELQALLAAPDQMTWIGRRDHALIMLAAQTGLRASELLGLPLRLSSCPLFGR